MRRRRLAYPSHQSRPAGIAADTARMTHSTRPDGHMVAGPQGEKAALGADRRAPSLFNRPDLPALLDHQREINEALR
jgi:hypothetical protein